MYGLMIHIRHSHTHSRLELCFIKSGTGQYEIGNRYYELKVGDVVLIPNAEPHRIVMRPGESLHNAVIHFAPEWIWNTGQCDLDYLFLQIFFDRGSLFSCVLDRDNPATAEIFRMPEDIERELMEEKNGWKLMVKIKLLNVFAYIIRFYDCCENEKTVQMSERDVAIMATVISYIKEYLTGNLTLEMLGKVANMNPSYFSTFFKRYNGQLPF